jgi:hypothetical protein
LVWRIFLMSRFWCGISLRIVKFVHRRINSSSNNDGVVAIFLSHGGPSGQAFREIRIEILYSGGTYPLTPPVSECTPLHKMHTHATVVTVVTWDSNSFTMSNSSLMF